MVTDQDIQFSRRVARSVLILIVMEDGHWHQYFQQVIYSINQVLILIVMEDGHWPYV